METSCDFTRFLLKICLLYMASAAFFMWDFLCSQEGNGASPGPCVGQPDQAQTLPVPVSPQQRQEGDWHLQGEEGCLCFKQEGCGWSAGEAAQGESNAPAGSEALQEAWANPEAAEWWTDSRRQRHAGLCTDGGNS